MLDSKQPIRILHLEDSPRDAELIQSRLEGDGLVCDFVRVDNQARFEFALAHDRFDVVLCDYNLPNYDGFSALKLARTKQSDAPVIVISGTLGEDEVVKCLQLGATDYLLKQRLERLTPAVKRALQEALEHRKRQQAETESRANEERFRQQAALLDQARDAILVCGMDQRITYWNKGAERLYGWTSEEVLRQCADELFSKDERPRQEEAHRLLLEKGEWVGELRNVSKSGNSLVVESRRTLLRDEQGNPKSILIIDTDITARKQAERQMLRAQRLESIGTLAGGVAHDLNNALAPILMATELLRLQYPGATEMIDTVERSARRGADMVRQLLTFAKGIEGARLLIQPQRLFNEMEKIILGTFPKNIQLQTTYAKNLRTVLGDATQLHQVLLNLCVNARDSMPNGGTLTLEADNAMIDAIYASTVPEARPGPYVVWRVTDTGTGIAPEILERIFEPFFSTKAPDKGTGLGLSTVIGIVKSHGGFVRIYSVPGQGSTFAVYLPADRPGTGDTDRVAKVNTTIRGHGETILVVDDEAEVRQVTRAVLTALNFTVLTAADGTEALIQVAEKRLELRAVITDLHMPNMDGLVFVRALRRMLPQAGIIVISGRLEEEEANEFKRLGVSVLLDKPFTQENLIGALETVFKK